MRTNFGHEVGWLLLPSNGDRDILQLDTVGISPALGPESGRAMRGKKLESVGLANAIADNRMAMAIDIKKVIAIESPAQFKK